MLRETAINALKAHEAELKQLGVEHPYRFGSTARGEARADSEIDLFFDYARGKFGVFALMDVKERASSILGQKADIMSRDGLEIISEASRHLAPELKDRHQNIAWKTVAGIGNILRHDYGNVAAPIIWVLVKRNVPELEQVCRDELANGDHDAA